MQNTLRRLRNAPNRAVEIARGARDKGRIRQLLGSDFAPRRQEAAEDLEDPYEEYVNEVSSRDMAVSIETASFLLALCRTRAPHTILDLGSGFSTYTFARYGGAVVHSFDDDSEWLERTRTFLAHHDVSVEQLSLFDDAFHGQYDLVFHDMGLVPVRIATLPAAMDATAPGGILVLDDLHKRTYRQVVYDAIRKRGGTFLSGRAVTSDSYKRWAGFWTP
jgi:predicted O-methyltransferase YrrM